LKKRLQEVETERDQLTRDTSTPMFTELSRKIQTLSRETNEIASKIREIESKISQNEYNVSSLTEDIDEIKNQSRSLNEELIDTRNKTEKSHSELSQTQEKKLEKEQDLETQNSELSKVDNERRKIKQDIDERRHQLDETNVVIRDYELDIARKQTQIKNSTYRISELKRELEQLGPVPKPNQLVSTKELTPRLTVIEIELEGLRPVNLKAIERFNVEEKKYDQLTQRRKVLLEEKKAVEEFMRQIEEEKTAVFMNTFNSINNNFSDVFALISPSGDAQLILENLDKPFLAGVDIRVRPAGKKVKNTRSMSGGEKALTALAFIFAIQKYNPAPFYVLDEIDASLDDVNADRVALLIHTLSRNNQFIIISLRDITISKADKLLGVARREGRSTVLSVDLGSKGVAESGR